MIESAEIMEIGLEIGIAGTEVARRETRGSHEVVGTEIASGREAEEILGIRGTHEEMGEDAMIGMDDVIERGRGRETVTGMVHGIGEIEVSTLMPHRRWFIDAGLMWNKMAAETNLVIDQGLERTREDEAEVHGGSETEISKLVARRRPTPLSRLRRSSRKAEQLHRR